MKNDLKIILILLLLAPFSKSKGQTVFPSWTDSPTWNVLECFWMNCSTTTYQYVYDTTFCNQTYSKVELFNNQPGYIRSDSVKTYFRKSSNCIDKEYLMYDYSLNLGDTAYVGFNLELGTSYDTTAFVLTQIDTVNYFGVARQRFKLNFDNCNIGIPLHFMYWIKGIGSETQPFYSFRCLCDACEYTFTLLCFDSTATQLYQNVIYNTCDTTVGLNEINRPWKISIEPNPFFTSALIKTNSLEKLEIQVYDTKGKLIKLMSGYSELSIGEELKSGIYFVKINTEKFHIAKKLVKL